MLHESGSAAKGIRPGAGRDTPWPSSDSMSGMLSQRRRWLLWFQPTPFPGPCPTPQTLQDLPDERTVIWTGACDVRFGLTGNHDLRAILGVYPFAIDEPLRLDQGSVFHSELQHEAHQGVSVSHSHLTTLSSKPSTTANSPRRIESKPFWSTACGW